MAKLKKLFFCSDCGNESAQWSGQCGSCSSWNTMAEAPTPIAAHAGKLAIVSPTSRVTTAPVALQNASFDSARSLPTGVDELDRVLGGGLVRGSVTLLGGEPGIGKSTIVLQLCKSIAARNGKCLIVTGEESVAQVGRRAERLHANVDGVMVHSESDVESILQVLHEVRPTLLVIDSIQTMSIAAVGSAAGSVSQVRESAQAFTSYAKQNNVATLIVGHVTKDGSIAGPRVLEHLVDTVLEFEGDRHHGLRFLRAVKHRFGSTDDVGVLEMTELGLKSVSDASSMFLEDRSASTPGSVVAPVMHGRKPMLVEIQALAHDAEKPRRYTQGLDVARLAMILAVLGKHCGVKMGGQDVYASVVGGIRVDDPGTDLAVALAVASTDGERPMPEDVIALGEVGLGGEVRKVGQLGRRLNEAARMGFKRAVVPKGSPEGPNGLELIRVSTVKEAIQTLAPKRR